MSKKHLEQQRALVGVWLYTGVLKPFLHGFGPLGRNVIEPLVRSERLGYFTHSHQAMRFEPPEFPIDLALRRTPVKMGDTLVDELLQVIA